LIEDGTVQKLRVLIVGEGRVVDVKEFDDPRYAYVADFNRLNKTTPFVAVFPPEKMVRARVGSRRCRPANRCRTRG
jgi:hypothetical protein